MPKCAGNSPKNIQTSGIFPSLDISKIRLRYSSAGGKFSLAEPKFPPER